jgi:hypothetical protein
MTNLFIRIIDIDHKNKIVLVDELTSNGAALLVEQCEKLLSQLRDRMYDEDQ